MTDHDLVWEDPARMDLPTSAELAKELRTLAAAMFGLRQPEVVDATPEPPALATITGTEGLVDPGGVLGASMADFDFDQTAPSDPEQVDEDEGAEVPTPPTDSSRWGIRDEPTIHNARTRAMLEEIAFLDE